MIVINIKIVNSKTSQYSSRYFWTNFELYYLFYQVILLSIVEKPLCAIVLSIVVENPLLPDLFVSESHVKIKEW